MPGSAPTVQLPVPSQPSVDVQTQHAQNAQELEITLRERLQQQRNSLMQSNTLYQRPHRVESSNLPTPPSTSNSEPLSPIDGAEDLRTVQTYGGIICDADAGPRNSRPEMRPMSTKVPEKSLRDRTRVIRNADTQENAPSYTKRPRSFSKSPSRSPAPTKLSAVQRRREYRNRSRSYSPMESSKRGRSYSPASRRSQSVDTEGSRGRRRESKGLQRSPSPNLSSRHSSRSFQSRSRSQGGDAYMTRARSTSTSSHCDQLAVEIVSSGRYSQSPPPDHVQQPPTPSTSSTGSDRQAQEMSRRGTVSSLQLRISGKSVNPRPVASKHPRRRTCPFYHPTDKDRHPLDGPHPGYSVAEFEEAVNLYEKGCAFPTRLIKEGVAVNPKNRQLHSMRSPIKSKFSSGYQTYSPQSPSLARPFQGHSSQARSRSPNESPIKRRKIGTTTSYHAREISNGENRGYSVYPTQPTTKFRNAATFRQGPFTSSYDGKGRNDYQNARFAGSSQPQRPAYGRQNPAPSANMGNYRWH
jgi:hypothetical protein